MNALSSLLDMYCVSSARQRSGSHCHNMHSLSSLVERRDPDAHNCAQILVHSPQLVQCLRRRCELSSTSSAS